ncbi:MAG: SH3 domain-containing protein [Anaerolineae bacterium]|nr:SH3 domain-containing protein [Anaerolineae bacterium]
MKRVLLLFLLIAGLAPLAQAQSASAQWACSQPTRLYVGGGGRVTLYPNLPNRVRSTPSYAGYVIGQIPSGGTFAVIGGPHCANGVSWWQVNHNGLVGWTAEGDGVNTYWLEPAGIVPFPTATPVPPTCALPNRLSVNGYGRVLPGLPNVVRTAPGTQSTGSNSYVIGQIPGGGVFNVQGGPQCGTDGRWWWYVNYNGLVGWTAEGEGYNNYWVEPWYNSPPPSTCPYALPARLSPGGYGRVTLYPYLPNRVRQTPGYGSSVIGYIPPGAVFSVLEGPQCVNNTNWWRVNYNGVLGWTAEGNSATYWLEPVGL